MLLGYNILGSLYNYIYVIFILQVGEWNSSPCSDSPSTFSIGNDAGRDEVCVLALRLFASRSAIRFTVEAANDELGCGLGFYRAGDTLAAAAVGGVPSAAGLGHGVASLGGGAQFQNRLGECFGIVHPLGGATADE